MGQIAFSGESTFDSFLDEIFVKSGLIESIIVPAANESCLEQLGVDYTNLDLSTLNEKFRALGEVHSEAEMLTAAAAWVDEINAVAPGSVDNVEKDATVQNMVDYYNKTIEATGGPYDLEKFVCVVASDGMESETVYTDYSSMVKSLMGQSTEGAGAAEELDTVLGAASKSLFGFVMFTIGVWFVLFLFSLLHIFAQNKRFMMWYVKLWGATPCFIFGVLPTFLAGLLKSTGDATVAAMAGIFTSLTTLTWISGACWLVLWLISIFWAFPIKRKIRADRKA